MLFIICRQKQETVDSLTGRNSLSISDAEPAGAYSSAKQCDRPPVVGLVEAGNYITSGPDVEGQVRQLRTGDGINFTRAGRMKLAFYVELEIRRKPALVEKG